MRTDLATPRLAAFLLFLLPLLPVEAATIPVTTTADADAADGFCSLREAILAANTDTVHNECPAGSGADRIVFAFAFPAAINLASALPPVTATVALRGPGSDLLAIDGQDLYRLLYFDSPSGGAWFLVEDLSLQHGLADDALGDFGGGVYLSGGDTLLLSRVVVGDCTAANAGGGVVIDGLADLPATAEIVDSILIGNRALGAGGGGGLLIDSHADVRIVASSIVGNSSEALHGGGAGMKLAGASATIERSTISGNAAFDSGAGIYLLASGGDVALALVDTTITDNVADADSNLDGDGGGIRSPGSASHAVVLTLVNSIVAENYDGGPVVNPDLLLGTGVTLVSAGFNLIGANDGAATYFPSGSPNVDGDFVGTAALPIDPMLQPLDLNQGITLSHRPVLDPASPVIDHGACPGRAEDQRGSGAPAFDRRAVDHPTVTTHASSDGCDIGSVERGASAKSAPDLFMDGFELGHTLRWSAETP